MKNIPVNIRMPKDMKQALEKMAEEDFTSLNAIILQCLRDNLKEREIDWRDNNSDK